MVHWSGRSSEDVTLWSIMSTTEVGRTLLIEIVINWLWGDKGNCTFFISNWPKGLSKCPIMALLMPELWPESGQLKIAILVCTQCDHVHSQRIEEHAHTTRWETLVLRTVSKHSWVCSCSSFKVLGLVQRAFSIHRCHNLGLEFLLFKLKADKYEHPSK